MDLTDLVVRVIEAGRTVVGYPICEYGWIWASTKGTGKPRRMRRPASCVNGSIKSSTLISPDATTRDFRPQDRTRIPAPVIAEIGINHEGSLEKAIRMVDDAAAAGCECVKFQSHVIETK